MIHIQLKKNLLTSQGPVLLNVDFKIEDGRCIAFYGPSGAGKTTILRMIAGLTDPDSGSIQVDKEVWFDSTKKINVPVMKRQIGFLFQDYNLFPNMTVRENLLYAINKKQDVSLVDDFLDMVHLRQLENHKPINLSGGQKQRIALIRALLRRPKIFLFDEPLSALDQPMRIKLQDEILNLCSRFKIPAIFVTHDLGEVFKVAHQIFTLDNGEITRRGKPGEIFADEALSGKFKFVGQILELKVEDFVCIITVEIGNNLTKVVATQEEAKDWSVGDRVLVCAKAFNPIILKI